MKLLSSPHQHPACLKVQIQVLKLYLGTYQACFHTMTPFGFGPEELWEWVWLACFSVNIKTPRPLWGGPGAWSGPVFSCWIPKPFSSSLQSSCHGNMTLRLILTNDGTEHCDVAFDVGTTFVIRNKLKNEVVTVFHLVLLVNGPLFLCSSVLLRIVLI